jgi:hypothetical protein
MMLDVLLQPTNFFRALSERKPNLVAPFFIVVAAAVAASLGQALLTRLLPSPIPGGVAVQLVLALVGGVVGGMVAWGLGGLVVRLLAGPDSRAWEVYGWASVPGLLVGLVAIPLAALFPITGDLPPIPPLTDVEAFQAWQRAYRQLIWEATGFRILQGLSLLSALWSFGIIWSALKVLAPAKALVTTLVIAAVSLAFMVWGLLSQR